MSAPTRRRDRPLTACRATKEEPWCCHNCQWHAADLSHPHTNGGRITQQRGWVCLAPEFDGVCSDWPMHGLCEMWSAS